MAYETKPNSGSLFKNEGERKRENGPDYSGTCLVGGVEYFFDGWLKTAESGRKWMSFAFKPKGVTVTKPADTRTLAERRPKPPVDDLDVPF